MSKYKKLSLLYTTTRTPYDYTSVVYGTPDSPVTYCALCGEDYKEEDRRAIFRVIPMSQGGPDSLENVRSVHLNCGRRINAKKMGKYPRVPNLVNKKPV